MQRIFVILVFCLAAVFPAVAATPPVRPDSLLPDAFAGWRKSVPSHTSRNAADADKVNPELLKEFGFAAFEDASYTRPERKIEIKAIRFNDASGAYGAFTYYKAPEMQVEKIGDQAASLNE